MNLGIMLGDTPVSVDPREHFDGVMRTVEAAQKAGMKHILIGQHFAFRDARWLQPVPLLARLAGETDDDVRLATQIMISPLYHPVMLAEEIATLDIVCNGRLDLGIGLGYLKEEYEIFGIPYEERIPRFEEGIILLRKLWSNDRVSFDGQFWKLDDIHVHIRPVQDPHPPLWLGAQMKAGILRAARFGDTWPITPQRPAVELPARIKIFAEERERLGKPLLPLPLRREIVVGETFEAAVNRATEMTRPYYQHMASIGANDIDAAQVDADMSAIVKASFVVGTGEQCAAQLRAIGDAIPIGPVVTRANWPGMSNDEVVGYVESLGEQLVPLLADYQPTDTLAPDAAVEPVV